MVTLYDVYSGGGHASSGCGTSKKSALRAQAARIGRNPVEPSSKEEETLDEILGLKERRKTPEPPTTAAQWGSGTLKMSQCNQSALHIQSEWYSKTLQFTLSKPEKLKEWLVAIWNIDIFIGPVPILKTACFINLVGLTLGIII